MVNELFTLNNVSLNFEGVQVLKNLSFTIYRNDFLGILGPSGSGKTTLLKLLVGIYQTNTGTLLYKGQNAIDVNLQIRKEIGFASQKYSFYEDLTIKENLIYFGKLYGMKSDLILKRMDQLLELVELTPYKNNKAMMISGGMQRRLDIACALIHDPPILILDEPLTGLDPQLREHIILLIKKIWASGKTVIMSSHFVNEMEGQCQKVCILKEGNLLTIGTPLDIRQNIANMYEVNIQTSPGNYRAIAKYLNERGVKLLNAQIKGGHLILYLSKQETPYNHLRNILIGLTEINESLFSIKLDTLSFEELFTRMVSNK